MIWIPGVSTRASSIVFNRANVYSGGGTESSESSGTASWKFVNRLVDANEGELWGRSDYVSIIVVHLDALVAVL